MKMLMSKTLIYIKVTLIYLQHPSTYGYIDLSPSLNNIERGFHEIIEWYVRRSGRVMKGT